MTEEGRIGNQKELAELDTKRMSPSSPSLATQSQAEEVSVSMSQIAKVLTLDRNVIQVTLIATGLELDRHRKGGCKLEALHQGMCKSNT